MNKKLKIFLCEDEENLGNILVELLETRGFSVDRFVDGEEGSNNFQAQAYDLCLLDVMMPKKDGFELAKEIRIIEPAIPIIFLTAMGQREHIHQGFKIGADDYLTKPFSMDELVLRIEAVLRRSGKLSQTPDLNIKDIFKIGCYTFNRTTHTLSAKLSFTEIEEIKANSDGKEPQILSKLVPIPNEDRMFLYKQRLTTKEYDLLTLLCQYVNQTLERELALEKIWKRKVSSSSENLPTQRNMDVYVNKLRRMLELDPKIMIKNIHGKGYILIVPN